MTGSSRRTPSPSARHRGAWALRTATGADWRVLVAHRHQMWAEIGGRTARELATHDRAYRRWALPRLKSGELVALVIESPGGGIAASGAVWFRPDQPRPGLSQLDAPYILSMYTEPRFRRHGLARRIVREALRICRKRGYRRVVLHAAPKGRRLYRTEGFERTWEMRITLER